MSARPPRKGSRWPKIVRHLVDGPKTINELAEITGARDSAVSRNLALLVDEELVCEAGRKGASRLWRWGP